MWWLAGAHVHQGLWMQPHTPVHWAHCAHTASEAPPEEQYGHSKEPKKKVEIKPAVVITGVVCTHHSGIGAAYHTPSDSSTPLCKDTANKAILFPMPATQAQRNLRDQPAVYIANPPPVRPLHRWCGHLGATCALWYKPPHPLARTLTRCPGHAAHTGSNLPHK